MHEACFAKVACINTPPWQQTHPPAVTMRDACFMKVACITAPPWQCTQALLPLRGSTNTRLGNGTLSLHHTRTWAQPRTVAACYWSHGRARADCSHLQKHHTSTWGEPNQQARTGSLASTRMCACAVRGGKLALECLS
eukprot:8853-Pelagomonas_calceolata.AAC.6